MKVIITKEEAKHLFPRLKLEGEIINIVDIIEADSGRVTVKNLLSKLQRTGSMLFDEGFNKTINLYMVDVINGAKHLFQDQYPGDDFVESCLKSIKGDVDSNDFAEKVVRASKFDTEWLIASNRRRPDSKELRSALELCKACLSMLREIPRPGDAIWHVWAALVDVADTRGEAAMISTAEEARQKELFLKHFGE